jgi:hypothetical protein
MLSSKANAELRGATGGTAVCTCSLVGLILRQGIGRVFRALITYITVCISIVFVSWP